MAKIVRPQPTTRPVLNVKNLAIETVFVPMVSRPPTALSDLFQTMLAFLLLLISLPILAIAMVAIRLSSRGPAIYTQTRLGRGGVPYTIYKLRTMRTDAEKDGKAQWAKKNDQRITSVGRFLRATHIDELPQLWNVLRGEMRLVGPRPERPEIVQSLRRSIPGYDRRLEVKPGITGLAQIHLPPDETTRCVRRKLVFDSFYVRHAGLRLDLVILICTALKVLGLKQLYRRRSSRRVV